jgi:hypothetical protein
MEALAREEPTLQALPMTRILGAIFSARLESLGGFSILRDAPGHPEMMERLWSRAWPGCIAGDLLLHLLQLRAAGLDASVNKAIAIELAYLSRATTQEGLPETERVSATSRTPGSPLAELWDSL